MRLIRGYWFEGKKAVHRKVWEDAYGKLLKGWVVHHIDFNKVNNALENLMALPEWLHDELHEQMRVGGFKFTRDQLEPLRIEYLAYYEGGVARLDALIESIRVLRLDFKSFGISTSTFGKMLMYRLWKRKILKDRKAMEYGLKITTLKKKKKSKVKRQNGHWKKQVKALQGKGIVALPCDVG